MSLKTILYASIILIVAGSLRFINLGFSEFQDDEKKAFIRLQDDQSIENFLVEQRKGPIQFIITGATTALGIDNRNELLVRMPFALLNTAGVFILFLLLTKLTSSKEIAVLGTLLFTVNGFIVGFSRIAQYQNLNIFFSLAALFCFYKLKDAKLVSNIKAYSIAGVLAFSLSILSHWDAIFYLVPIIYYYLLFLRNSSVDRELKKTVTFVNVIIGIAVIVPFIAPYFYNHVGNQSNISYFNSRVSFPSTYPLEKHVFIFELYNPYIALYLLPILSAFAIFNIKKNWIYLLWFVINFTAIRFLMDKPGTHIYNYVIPLIFLATLGMNQIKILFSKTGKWATAIPVLLLTCILALLYIQSYLILVDNKKFYPWEEETLYFGLTTEKYKEREVLTFGFPHNHNWKGVADIIDNDKDNCSYITNEGKEISQIYVKAKYGKIQDRKCYYIVKIYKPFISTRTNTNFAKVHKKDPLYTYSMNGEVLTEVFKVKN